MEADAGNQLFRLMRLERIRWVASPVVDYELRKNPDQVTRGEVLKLLAYSSDLSSPDRNTIRRARSLQAVGYGPFDGFHLALAEQSNCDVLLTTDDRFLRLASRGVGNPGVELANPVEWLTRKNLWQL
jgi:predicted nucleic acid-binding protein